jgi:hypothetical protein
MIDDGLRWRKSEVLAALATMLLMSRGELPRPPEKLDFADMQTWRQRHVLPAKWQATLAEVEAMTPEERGNFIRPWIGDYDA